MEQRNGTPISKGIAVGRIWCYSNEKQSIPKYKVQHTEEEVARYEAAKGTASAELEPLYKKALDEVGESDAAIFDAQSMMLSDEDFNELVYHFIRSEQVNAEYAFVNDRSLAADSHNYSVFDVELDFRF